MEGRMIQAGTMVRLKKAVADGDTAKAKVLALLTDIEGGLFLDKPLNGFRYWNIKDVVRVRS
jgi:hypothetical protein